MGMRRLGLAIASVAVIAVAPFVVSQPAGATVHTDEQSASLSFTDFNGHGQFCTVFVSGSLDTSTRVLTTTGSSNCGPVTFVLTLTYKDADGRSHTVHTHQREDVDVDVDGVFSDVQAKYDATFGACEAGPPGQTCSTTATAAPK